MANGSATALRARRSRARVESAKHALYHREVVAVHLALRGPLVLHGVPLEQRVDASADLLALPPADRATRAADPATARAWVEGIRTSAELAATCEAAARAFAQAAAVL
jgi:hypothetical protein